ncbi:hypothetical protein GO755_27840 [Spirosoma sp. HMF4905]|uniref:Uncharacterized protein n=1 Tax=Spirosoma arboris TaxID=2682092 RepID=A0A7K1SJ99_9BACT|nr:hypothetical protein [Spirosoma arboris]MVM33880.1 hypothetical protein [Spirosoma arboris]
MRTHKPEVPFKVDEPIETGQESTTLSYVLYMEDGNCQEFFLNSEGTLKPITDESFGSPFIATTVFQVYSQLSNLRMQYSSSCRFFALEYSEFEVRRMKSIFT